MPRKLWTKKDEDILKRLYPKTDIKVIMHKLGRTKCSIYGHCKKIGVKRNSDYKLEINKKLGQKLSSSDNGHRYLKGHVPANKGKKMSKSTYAIAARTMFKKGNMPANTLPDIAITIRRDSSGRKYWWIKHAYKNWEMYHVYLWKRENGPIPRGFIVVFKDKNSLNCLIENLEIITHRENMLRNTIHNLPEEIKSTIHIIGRITRKINKYAKQNQ